MELHTSHPSISARLRQQLKNSEKSLVWWCTPDIPALERLRQED
jgi:hypothetical protein